MKQKIGPGAIVAGLCALIIVIFVLYRVFLPAPTTAMAPGASFQRPGGYTPPAPGTKGPAAGNPSAAGGNPFAPH